MSTSRFELVPQTEFILLDRMRHLSGIPNSLYVSVILKNESPFQCSRGTCYGISAAVGKAGAAIGTQAFTPIQNNLGKKLVLILNHAVMSSLLTAAQVDFHHCCDMWYHGHCGDILLCS